MHALTRGLLRAPLGKNSWPARAHAGPTSSTAPPPTRAVKQSRPPKNTRRGLPRLLPHRPPGTGDGNPWEPLKHREAPAACLPCLQVRVCFSRVSFKTHMTPLPKDASSVLGNCMRARREKELNGKAVTAQASGVRPGGRGASSTCHLWATASVSLT